MTRLRRARTLPARSEHGPNVALAGVNHGAGGAKCSQHSHVDDGTPNLQEVRRVRCAKTLAALVAAMTLGSLLLAACGGAPASTGTPGVARGDASATTQGTSPVRGRPAGPAQAARPEQLVMDI